jgi:hypothetical protein
MSGRTPRIALFVACAGLFVSALAAAAAEGDKVVGWRGDGSGRFPDANPPTQWGKVSRVMSGLRCRADKPRDDKPGGTPACCGAITEWLVLGPFPLPADGKGIDEALLEDEAGCRPAEGDKVKGLAWRKVTVPGTALDFSALYAKDSPDAEYLPYHELHFWKAPYAAYAHAWLYAADEGTVEVRVRAQKQAKVWVNGVQVFPVKQAMRIPLKKGWNSILAKAVNAVFDKKPGVWTNTDYPSWWFVDVNLSAAWPFETEKKNIRWATELPNYGVASPVIVGSRIFVMAEPGRVICVDKKTGGLLWDRDVSLYDVLSEKERGDPAFKEVAAPASRLAEIRAAVVKPAGLTPELAKERDDLNAQIAKLMQEADPKRFTIKVAGHGNCLPTPVSDGKAIYVFLGSGLAASYTLDGELRWASVVSPERNQEHGITSSAAFAGGKLIVFHIDLAGLDANTGRVEWKLNVWRKEPFYGDLTHQTPVPFRVEGEDYVYFYGEIVRVSDGTLAWEGGPEWVEKQVIPTPVIEGGMLYDLWSSGKLHVASLPTLKDKIALDKPATGSTFTRVIGAATRGFACASPLYHDGLVYVVDAMGSLFVLDAKTLKVVYRKDLGTGFEARSVVHTMGTAYASPVLAGTNIYIFGMNGTTVVVKPGRKYEEVARNKIEDILLPQHWSAKPESFASTPVADGDCLYVRGDKYLYCIGK